MKTYLEHRYFGGLFAVWAGAKLANHCNAHYNKDYSNINHVVNNITSVWSRMLLMAGCISYAEGKVDKNDSIFKALAVVLSTRIATGLLQYGVEKCVQIGVGKHISPILDVREKAGSVGKFWVRGSMELGISKVLSNIWMAPEVKNPYYYFVHTSRSLIADVGADAFYNRALDLHLVGEKVLGWSISGMANYLFSEQLKRCMRGYEGKFLGSILCNEGVLFVAPLMMRIVTRESLVYICKKVLFDQDHNKSNGHAQGNGK